MIGAVLAVTAATRVRPMPFQQVLMRIAYAGDRHVIRPTIAARDDDPIGGESFLDDEAV